MREETLIEQRKMTNGFSEKIKEKILICDNISVGENGNLFFAGQDTAELAAKYGTPLYLMDEDRIRQRCRTYLSAVKHAFHGNAKVFYASKAASFKRLYAIMKEEGMGVDVVSRGEILTAFTAGFPMENSCFHSNNKTDEDISYAMDKGVGFFAADNIEELYSIEREAEKRSLKQKVILRLTPGIDPHTYAAVATGKVDSKFGFAIETGQAENALTLAMSLPHIDLYGFHCHVGSQVFDSSVYCQAAEVMLGFVSYVKKKFGFITRLLDLGGGYGVRYIADQPCIDIEKNIELLAEKIYEIADKLGIDVPQISLEPGRSIVADAGMTLYSVGTVKTIPEYKKYVSVDGGMTDNIRFALYGSPYTVVPACGVLRDYDMKADVVGRCCESGDIIQKDVELPSNMKRGDILACFTTGAYHYSMSSQYNKIPRPPIVMLSGGESYVAVKRETEEDLMRLDN